MCIVPGQPPLDRTVMWNAIGMRLFDVPVYRVSPAEFQREQDREFDRLNERLRRPLDDPDLADRWRWKIWDMVRRESGGGFQFNQIMGWVQVVWDGPGPVIKCYYVRIAARRVGRVFRARHFEEVGKITEVWWGPGETSTDILSHIRADLVAETRRRGMMHGRFLDLEVFDNLAPVLDLQTLMRIGRRPIQAVQFAVADPEDDQC